MDKPIQRPLGLAALITATVTLLSTGAMDQAGQPGTQDIVAQQASDEIALSSDTFSPSIVTALQGNSTGPADQPMRSRSHQQRIRQQVFQSQPTLSQKPFQGPNLPSELQKELPEDIRTARLMLSVESLLKATTPN